MLVGQILFPMLRAGRVWQDPFQELPFIGAIIDASFSDWAAVLIEAGMTNVLATTYEAHERGHIVLRENLTKMQQSTPVGCYAEAWTRFPFLLSYRCVV
jgi:hypothetical protein